MKAPHLYITFVIALAIPCAAAHAQSGPAVVFVGEPDGGKWQRLELIEAAKDDAIAQVSGAPFSARAVTEFVQVLGDGNRIERRFESFVARDSRGRTRREEDVVFVGPLATTGPAPKLVTIIDPDADVSYTLDERQRVAHRSQLAVMIVTEKGKIASHVDAGARPAIAKRLETEHLSGSATVESLGRRSFGGVMAEGTRTTTTIPAGVVGNLQPIEIVSERWFSPDLQMPVLITRRDPRVGNTEYRLIDIHRGEPAAHLFRVPPDYEIHEGKTAVWKKLEAKKIEDANVQKGLRLK